MKFKQVYQEINLNISNQIKGNAEEKLSQLIGFLYGGAFDEIFEELLKQNDKKM